ncbi:unnamed protein product [Heligmosomoides polygyrus]|uniref:Neur_chan_memb domain-containing protein n=1 Tax=Heligmosomoides polygyrus TaxID=6339 RepID=A0A3P8DHG3_HELPZ|nr:unnamed protein product [Heligmosomoides polygyrus]
MMVFCSLVEYAAVGYINKRMKLQAKKRDSRVSASLPSPTEPTPSRMLSMPAYFNRGYRPFYSSTDTNSNLYIPEGQRAPLTLQVALLFPLCDGYTMADIDYFWGRQRSDPRQSAVVFGNFMLPQFKQTCYHVNYTKATTSSGQYRRLYFEILLVRNMGFYSMNIVIPSMLIVTISWVSFWLNREASPARVGLGVTTVLTMTTLITTTNNSMPKVSYIKGLDVFLNFCFVMVFASLVEYAVVSYMNKRIVLRREKRRRQAEQQQRSEVPMFSNALSPKQPNNNVNSASLRPQH